MKKQIFELELLTGGTVRSSMKLSRFSYVDGDVTCIYIDIDGDERHVRKKENNITQEEKELLLKDLCARLTYGVK